MKKIYRGNKRQAILFPLGGIGTGSIGLDGTGRLRDWEIFNHPSKGGINGFSHFGIKAESEGKLLTARVMHSDLLGAYTGRYIEHNDYVGFGYGPFREEMCGVPHFRDCEFAGEFPLAEVRFIDETFPGKVSLEAFNPFIPSNDEDSSIPAALFTAVAENNTDQPLDYTFELSVGNPSKHTHIQRYVKGTDFHGMELTDDFHNDRHQDFGSIVFGVPVGDDAQIQKYWYRGRWFDGLGIFWQDFCADGTLKARTYEPDPACKEDTATVAVRCTVAPGETWRQRFVIAWHYPNCIRYWQGCNAADKVRCANEDTWKNYYASLFKDALSVADYVMGKWNRLEADTRSFHDALFASNLPEAALDAVSANLEVLNSATVLRLANGEFYGFEGTQTNVGCCEGSCTHVWNYAFALPFLFPKLERSMRELDYTYNIREDGGMPFRLQLPLGSPRSSFRPCVDGQFGGVIKTYREWKICGSDEWLRKWWPSVKKSIEFAWSPSNTDQWDPDKSGVITGRQHHTLDMELFGPNAWLNTFYTGALTAAAEMADALGDEDAQGYRALADRGRSYIETELFNGEYYFQNIDIRNREILKPYEIGEALTGGSAMDVYWNSEAQQLKYQIAEGCDIDQVMAQWMCELSGIGSVLEYGHVTTALQSIYRNNFKHSLREHFNPCRIYGLNDEAGLVICDWPEGKEKPVVPIPYAEECMHGFEYQAAIHMIMHGMEKEGMDVVKGIRDRYDGEKRNPWNEMECGSNYARSMASFGLLLAFSGFRYDMRKKRMGLLPLHEGAYFWALDGAWGICSTENKRTSLEIRYGEMSLKEWIVPNADYVKTLSVDGIDVNFTAVGDALILDEAITLVRGNRIEALC